jgi:hypothetical protein
MKPFRFIFLLLICFALSAYASHHPRPKYFIRVTGHRITDTAHPNSIETIYYREFDL